MKKITLIDTYKDYTDDEVKEFCESCEMEVPVKDTQYDYDVRAKMREYDVDDFWEEIKDTNDIDTCVVMGRVGRWNGTFEIVPQVFDSVYDAIKACVEGAWDMIVVQNHSTIEVTALDHDGRSHFDIRILNGYGRDAWDKVRYEGANIDLSRRCYHKTLKNYIY